MKAIRHIAAALFLAAIAACTGGKGGKDFQPVHLSTPKAPSMMDGEQALAYVAAHYWDNLTDTSRHYPCDSTLVSGVPVMEVEQAMANYIALQQALPLETAQGNLRKLVSRLELCERSDSASNVFDKMRELVDRYFYDPNSPLRDEDIYAAFADGMSRCTLLPEVKRSAYAGDAADCSLNSRGSIATDFSFSDRNGRTYTLHGIRADYTILFFSNPGCTACKEIIDALRGDDRVNAAIADGRAAVLNIYIDQELKEWYDYMPIYPATWYNGYDHNFMIRSENLYNVRAIPSLYLLDKDKRVLMKDVPLEKLINNLPWQQ